MRSEEVFVARLARLACLCLTVLALGCTKAAPKPVVPAAPVPPHEPLAWLPEDVSVIGRVDPPVLRASPLGALWELILREPAAAGALVDANKITRAVFAGSESPEHQPSFVAALSGDFGAGSIAAAAQLAQIPAEPVGLLTFFRRERVAYAQVYDDLVLVCSLDRLEALGARASQGDAVKVRDTLLFKALSARLRWDQVDFALLAEDPSGQAKAIAERRAERYGFPLPVKELMRAGVGLKLGPTTALAVVAEAPDEAHAAALRSALEGTLENLGGNMLVALVGLRDFVRALHVGQDTNFVQVAGEQPQADFNGALVRLLGLVGIEATAEGAPQPASP
jgi:hypothetical protein